MTPDDVKLWLDTRRNMPRLHSRDNSLGDTSSVLTVPTEPRGRRSTHGNSGNTPLESHARRSTASSRRPSCPVCLFGDLDEHALLLPELHRVIARQLYHDNEGEPMTEPTRIALVKTTETSRSASL